CPHRALLKRESSADKESHPIHQTQELPGSALKAPMVPRPDTDHRTIYLTGIDANGKVASACGRLRALSRPPAEAVRVGSFRGQGWPWIPTTPIDTREETLDSSLVVFQRRQNIWKTAGAPGPHQPL